MKCCWFWALALVVGAAAGVRADDELARERFERGVRAASDGRWQEAKQLLEASLRESDKPATRYNLIVAHQQLGDPLELVRHALVFLGAPPSPGQMELRDSVRELLDAATKALAVVTIDALPPDAQLVIDDAAPALLQEGHVYLAPGRHRFELRRATARVEAVEAELAAGETVPWPRAPAQPALHAALEAPRQLALREPFAAPAPGSVRAPASTWGLGIGGAIIGLTATGLYAAAEYRGRQLADSDMQAANYVPSADRYSRLKYTVLPFAFAGGALLASAFVADTVHTRRGSNAWAIASLVLGGALLVTGGVLMAQPPLPLVEDTDLKTLSRERGGLLLSASLPFLGYGVTFLVGRR